jgi:hypothetical protein
MRYAKLIDGNLQPSPNPIYIDPYWVGNPTPEMLTAEGYKPVVYSDPPGEAPSGFQWSEIWSEDDFNIQQGWVLVEVSITEEEALVRYANEITGAENETLVEATETLIKKVMEE